jgi:hypothetical protein
MLVLVGMWTQRESLTMFAKSMGIGGDGNRDITLRKQVKKVQNVRVEARRKDYPNKAS